MTYEPTPELNKLREMIADVDCDENELNARFRVFDHFNKDFKCTVKGCTIYYKHKSWAGDAPSVIVHNFEYPNYTKSLDALYECIPDGHGFYISKHFDKSCCDIWTNERIK